MHAMPSPRCGSPSDSLAWIRRVPLSSWQFQGAGDGSFMEARKQLGSFLPDSTNREEKFPLSLRMACRLDLHSGWEDRRCNVALLGDAAC
eukprot:TRINITY_DN8079_c0_g1_i1.p1 TRINITY_DN8079_c0_g1~~TRINITY_DN8079_c0_g1_i1.p1  ORF type:complete len:104 (+),score=13.13 TRINITY_DN8079_c0_g1_i1:45-314(+)